MPEKVIYHFFNDIETMREVIYLHSNIIDDNFIGLSGLIYKTQNEIIIPGLTKNRYRVIKDPKLIGSHLCGNIIDHINFYNMELNSVPEELYFSYFRNFKKSVKYIRSKI